MYQGEEGRNGGREGRRETERERWREGGKEGDTEREREMVTKYSGYRSSCTYLHQMELTERWLEMLRIALVSASVVSNSILYTVEK